MLCLKGSNYIHLEIVLIEATIEHRILIINDKSMQLERPTDKYIDEWRSFFLYKLSVDKCQLLIVIVREEIVIMS